MAGKSKSAKSSRGSGKKKAKKSAKSRAASAPVQPDKEIDIMNPHAMENLYYIAHGAVHALQLRGFSWTGAPKKGKGKKGKKKK